MPLRIPGFRFAAPGASSYTYTAPLGLKTR